MTPYRDDEPPRWMTDEPHITVPDEPITLEELSHHIGIEIARIPRSCCRHGDIHIHLMINGEWSHPSCDDDLELPPETLIESMYVSRDCFDDDDNFEALYVESPEFLPWSREDWEHLTGEGFDAVCDEAIAEREADIKMARDWVWCGHTPSVVLLKHC